MNEIEHAHYNTWCEEKRKADELKHKGDNENDDTN